MGLHSIRVVTVAAVIRTDARLHICYVPGLAPKYMQESSGIHRSCPNFRVDGLPDDATLAAPELLQPEYGSLGCWRVCHPLRHTEAPQARVAWGMQTGARDRWAPGPPPVFMTASAARRR